MTAASYAMFRQHRHHSVVQQLATFLFAAVAAEIMPLLFAAADNRHEFPYGSRYQTSASGFPSMNRLCVVPPGLSTGCDLLRWLLQYGNHCYLTFGYHSRFVSHVSILNYALKTSRRGSCNQTLCLYDSLPKINGVLVNPSADRGVSGYCFG